VDIILVSLLVVNGDFTEKREEEHAGGENNAVGDTPNRHFPSCGARATSLDRTFRDRQRGPDAVQSFGMGEYLITNQRTGFRLSLTVDVSAVKAANGN
jgi:hypothetical protein